MPPVPASNYRLGGDRVYVRNESSPTWEALEELVGGLEQGEALAWSSGMAAVAGVLDLVPAGGVVVLPDDCYQGVVALARRHEAAGGSHQSIVMVFPEPKDGICTNGSCGLPSMPP